jgi:phage terminase large subunit-like protein
MNAWHKPVPRTDVIAFLKSLETPEARRRGLALLGEQDREAIDRAWEAWAHDGQLAPASCPDGSPWSTWVIQAGRGFGKTLAGAQWIAGLVAAHETVPLKIALVGATIDDARRVMVEGRSGLLEVAGPLVATWTPSRFRLRFTTGAEAVLFSGAAPDLLRGPEHHYAWCDELAKWDKAQESWDMLQLGLRLGTPDGLGPRALVTTTPRPGPVLKGIIEQAGTVVTGGPTHRNPHLPQSWKQRVERLYAGTRLGRQELDGELLPDAAGALWTVELIERCRYSNPPRACLGEGDHPEDGGGGGGAAAAGAAAPLRHPAAPGATSPSKLGEDFQFSKTLIAVDPPSGDGTCGIVACAREGSGDSAIGHVLADHSVTARSPEGWAAAVAAAARAHGTIDIVAEDNQGGKMIRAVLHTADPGLRIKPVHAHAGKAKRAEPVAHLFEAGRAVLHGRMPELEAQLLGLIAGGGYEGPGQSPDRADAMVWGLTELMLGTRREPKIWRV